MEGLPGIVGEAAEGVGFDVFQLDTANLENAVAKSQASLDAAAASVAQARAAVTEARAALARMPLDRQICATSSSGGNRTLGRAA